MRSSFTSLQPWLRFFYTRVCLVVVSFSVTNIKTRSFDKQPWKFLRELRVDDDPGFYSRPISECIKVIMLENRVFKGCKGIISVLYLQTMELIDNRKLKQIDPK